MINQLYYRQPAEVGSPVHLVIDSRTYPGEILCNTFGEWYIYFFGSYQNNKIFGKFTKSDINWLQKNLLGKTTVTFPTFKSRESLIMYYTKVAEYSENMSDLQKFENELTKQKNSFSVTISKKKIQLNFKL